METQYLFFSKHSKNMLKPYIFESTISHGDDEDHNHILERIFSACNRGSRFEDPSFTKSKISSLSVGDEVCLKESGKTYVCENVGWSLK